MNLSINHYQSSTTFTVFDDKKISDFYLLKLIVKTIKEKTSSSLRSVKIAWRTKSFNPK